MIGEKLITVSAEKPDKARLILRYIETRILEPNESLPEKEEKEVAEYYKKKKPKEKADILYGKLMAYAVDKQAETARKKTAKEQGANFEVEKPDPHFISEVKVLLDDPAVKQLFLTTYSEMRVDTQILRASELGNLWKNTVLEIVQKEEVYQGLEKELHLAKVTGAVKISATKSRMARLANNLAALERTKHNLENLEGYPKTQENTDAVANFQYETLLNYKKQLEGHDKFVKLPSRRKIHQQVVSAILNHRWPNLVGEAGSGKSHQANAAAMELTGYLPTELECETTTGEAQMMEDIAVDPETGGSYKEYGPLMQAYTGYEDSRQQKPAFVTGRICRFDEALRLGNKAYSIIKKVRQLSSGDSLNGKKVLSGAGAIWTSNPVGPRYPDRHAPDPAMRREIAEINVSYPDMDSENPELYEFALTTLFDEHQHIEVAKEELSPAYEKKEIPENEREVLADHSIIIAKDEIIKNMADARHGALWRFTVAIKALQDSFVYGNAETERYPDTLLRYKEDANGVIEVTDDGSGEPLTLSTSTVTLGELASWMKGFNERRQKQDQEFRVETFTEWLNFKINTYLKQADKADKEKLAAIFRHFGFLERSVIPDLRNAKPLTPKEIGYLSPRVPRPVYLERPALSEAPKSRVARAEAVDIKVYETKDVVMESGQRLKIKKQPFKIWNANPRSNY